MNITIDSVLVQDDEPTTAEVDQGAIVLSVRAGCYFGFNSVTSEIRNMLAEPCPVGQIFDALTARRDVDAGTLARDVTPFLQSLLEQRLARVTEPGETR